ncbi:MAG: transglutaminase family protein [Deltaproteobacteria bacterium]|nr:transglutaminase family protein [Deltaproteobacteria bacterium]
MRIRLKHQTRYGYADGVALGPHWVRLRPADHSPARLLSYNLQVDPRCEVRWQQDPWGNRVARLTFPEGATTSRLGLTVDAALELVPVNPFDFFVDDRCRELPFVYPDGLREELEPFLDSVRPGPRLAAWTAGLPARGYVVDYLVALNRRVASDVRYILRQEPGVQKSEETLERGSGSCRDSALLLVDALRAQGLAARFVSGYLIQLVDEGIIPGERKGVASDVLDLHAWAEVFVPGAGWIGLDGTSGLLCGEGHIPLASATTPELAAPVSGTASGEAVEFSCRMEVTRLGHESRPRKPYTDEVWREIVAAGEFVDAQLASSGLALTSGGEPTWTSREHPRAPEWNAEALGPTKWTHALRFASALRGPVGRGALVLQRQGKQYPGESLPRFAIDLWWREDGVPIWREASRLVLPAGGPGAVESDGLEAAARFGAALTARLGVPANWLPAYEDPWPAILAEENLPLDVDPLDADLSSAEERRRLARLLAPGLGEPVGFVLPVRRTGSGWATSAWRFRRRNLFLLPGDGPIGLRLPLDRLEGSAEPCFEADTTVAPAPFAFDPRSRQAQRAVETAASPVATTQPRTSVSRTALCLEPRDGLLRVFLPPLPEAESFLELVAAVEDAATECELSVSLEGYPPPVDPRLRVCVVSPDPGVLEVNVPVSRSFAEYTRWMELLADAANHAGLSTEKFQLDGREVGSGGGHHLTLGGPSTVESPFLLRPELLGALLTYVQRHPALSFLFTGLFVGPTSQAPRVDEARHDALYELELAISRTAHEGQPPFPWLADRLFRNLLVDVAGSTHRTELCIDKLYSPAGTSGRQGIIELRAFEMPPHERMAAVQMLLVRAVVARCALTPPSGGLVRWGTQLHDRFMLPHYLWADLEDVVADLRLAGLPLTAEWFRPFLDYRFPILGRLEREGVVLELRNALEPWPVLGEEPTGATVSRFVDSSLERLQVRVEGLVPERHQVLVNGFALPLHPTGRADERVAGVRFRAWQPPHCLQPTIGMHHPVRFDLVDLWGRRSLGACTYHVWHPEGRAFDDSPLTASEAGARRRQRFTLEGHLPWPVEPKPTQPSPDYPYTLDLRLYPGARA